MRHPSGSQKRYPLSFQKDDIVDKILAEFVFVYELYSGESCQVGSTNRSTQRVGVQQQYAGGRLWRRTVQAPASSQLLYHRYYQYVSLLIYFTFDSEIFNLFFSVVEKVQSKFLCLSFKNVDNWLKTQQPDKQDIKKIDDNSVNISFKLIAITEQMFQM